MDDEAWQDTCPRYPIKEDGGVFWSDMMLTHDAYEKGILPEPGGIGSQPIRFLPMMALLRSRLNEEREVEREKREAARGRGRSGTGQSPTEEYMEKQGIVTSDDDDPFLLNTDKGTSKFSPDGFAIVPGLLKPRPPSGRG